MKQSNILKGTLLCTIAGVTFGGQWPVAKSALKVIDPFFFTLIRYLIVAIILSVILVIKEGKEKLKFDGKALSVWFLGSMSFCIYNFLVFMGQKMVGESGAILGSVLMATIPFVSVLVLWVYKKEKPSSVTLTCIAFAFIGVLMVITKGDFKFFLLNKNQIFPIFLMFISVLAWVIYTIGVGSFKDWSPLRYTTLTCILGNITSIIVIGVGKLLGYIEMPSFDIVYQIRWEIIYMAVVSGVIGVLAWNAGNKILTPMNGSLFMNLVPIVTFIVSIILGYEMTVIEILGSIVTIASLGSNNLYQRRTISKEEESPIVDASNS